MAWRLSRSHCEPFESIDPLLEAAHDFSERMIRAPERTRAIIGAHPA